MRGRMAVLLAVVGMLVFAPTGSTETDGPGAPPPSGKYREITDGGTITQDIYEYDNTTGEVTFLYECTEFGYGCESGSCGTDCASHGQCTYTGTNPGPENWDDPYSVYVDVGACVVVTATHGYPVIDKWFVKGRTSDVTYCSCVTVGEYYQIWDYYIVNDLGQVYRSKETREDSCSWLGRLHWCDFPDERPWFGEEPLLLASDSQFCVRQRLFYESASGYVTEQRNTGYYCIASPI